MAFKFNNKPKMENGIKNFIHNKKDVSKKNKLFSSKKKNNKNDSTHILDDEKKSKTIEVDVKNNELDKDIINSKKTELTQNVEKSTDKLKDILDTKDTNKLEEQEQTDERIIEKEIKKIEKPKEIGKKFVEKTIPEEPVNAEFSIEVSSSKMTATLTMTEALNGGDFVLLENVYSKLKMLGIVYGVDKKAIERAIVSKMVGSVDIAFGTEAVDGENAKIINHYDKIKSKKPLEKANGTIDFKCLDFIDVLNEGDIISELIPATEGQNGKNVLGRNIPCKKGKVAKLTAGKNTFVTEDGLLLIAKATGHITYKQNTFFVEDILTIKSDIDNKTGNIEFNGNVIIDGDVCEGYSVTADGNILIKGSVVSSYIHCKGNIVVEKGINGGFKGNLQIGGNITSRFIENCNVVCKGDIFTECILNCSIICDGLIEATSGKGVIAGGYLSSNKEVKCKVLGSSGGTVTNVNIGMTLDILNKKKELTLELDQLKEQIIKIEQNIAYINSKLENREIPAEIKALLLRLKKEKPVNLLTQRHLQKQLAVIYDELASNRECSFNAEKVYYHSSITMANTQYICEKDYINVSAYINDEGEPVIEKKLKEF